MNMAMRVQIIDKTVYISHGANTLGNGMNLIIILLGKGK